MEEYVDLIDLPLVDPTIFRHLADYEFRADGIGYDGDGNVLPLVDGMYKGWKWKGNKWEFKVKAPDSISTMLYNGTFYIETDVKIDINAKHKGKHGGVVCCKGKVTELTLEYQRSVDAVIKVVQKNGDVVFNDTVTAGGQFSFVGTDNGTLGTEITIFIDDVENTKIHTSCSKPIGIGLISGDFEVVAGRSKEGGDLCPLDSEPGYDESFSWKVTFLAEGSIELKLHDDKEKYANLYMNADTLGLLLISGKSIKAKTHSILSGLIAAHGQVEWKGHRNKKGDYKGSVLYGAIIAENSEYYKPKNKYDRCKIVNDGSVTNAFSKPEVVGVQKILNWTVGRILK